VNAVILTAEPSPTSDGTRRVANVLGPTAGIVAVSAVIFVVLVAAFTDVAVGDAVVALLQGPFGSVDAMSETLTRAVPLAIVGVGAALGLRAGVFNVGGESQMIMGAVGAVVVTDWVGGGPVALVWLLAAAAGLVGGAAWAVVPAVLWAKRDVSEILSTLLINFVTVALLEWLLTETWLKDPDPYVITAQGAPLPDRLLLPVLIDGSRIHAGAFAALAAIALTSWALRSGLGYRVDLVGANSSLAGQAGIHALRLRLGALLGSAAFAGLAGAVQVFGVSHRLSTGLTGGVGYTAVLVAVLGRARPLATGVAAVIFAALVTGGESLEREGVPRTLSAVIQAVLIVGVALAVRTPRPSGATT
jgi:simple sugar transport system permease protein